MPHRFGAGHGGTGSGTPTSDNPHHGDREEHASEARGRATQQNSYRLESKRPWVSERVLDALKAAMHEHLDSVQYDPEKCAELATAVAEDVRGRVRELNFDRYKIACIVEIGEKLFQGFHSEVRLMGDPQRDRYVSYHLTNTRIIATGTVFGLYFE